MKLTILGSGTCVPSPEGHEPSADVLADAREPVRGASVAQAPGPDPASNSQPVPEVEPQPKAKPEPVLTSSVHSEGVDTISEVVFRTRMSHDAHQTRDWNWKTPETPRSARASLR